METLIRGKQRNEGRAADEHHILKNMLEDPFLKKDRIKARKIYREILFFQQEPKQKKELWRRLGKCLSLNDFEFDYNGKESHIKKVSTIKLEGTRAQSLSVDCLRSFCAKLAIRNSGRLNKKELMSIMSEVSKLVRSKLTPKGLGYHEKVQDLIWLEDVPKGWDIPPKSASQEKDNSTMVAGSATSGRNDDAPRNTREENIYEEDLTSSGDSFHQSYLDSINNEDGEIGLVCKVGGNYVLSSTEDEESLDNVDDFDGNGSVGNNENADVGRPDYKLKATANGKMMDVMNAEMGGNLDASPTTLRNQIYKREREDKLVIDISTEKKVEVAIKYLMKAWEHHKVKSGECQVHINTLVELREMHDTRLRAIRRKIDELILYYDNYN
jgi:hypothetical protein